MKYEVGYMDTYNMLAVVVAYVAHLPAAINMAKQYRTGYVYQPKLFLEQGRRDPFPIGWHGKVVFETNGELVK